VQARVGLLARVWILLMVAGFVVSCDRITSRAEDLQVGECFDQPVETTEISDVQRQPCTEAHDAEVFLVVDHPEAEAYPISLTFDNFVDEQCKPAFNTYTGLDYDTSTDLNFSYFYPTRESWNDGDREVTCFIVRADGTKMTSPVRAATET
jgi:hypothetical protein